MKDTKTIQNLNFISKCTYQYIHFRLPLNFMNIESMKIIAYRFIQISKFTAYHEHCLLCRNRTIARNFCIIIDFRKRAFIQLINYLSISNLYIHLHHLISPFSCFLFMGIIRIGSISINGLCYLLCFVLYYRTGRPPFLCHVNTQYCHLVEKLCCFECLTCTQ